jgi:hypothetical protein
MMTAYDMLIVGWAAVIVAAELLVAAVLVGLTVMIVRGFGPRDHKPRRDDWRWNGLP